MRRWIDIYKEGDGGLAYLMGGLQQIGIPSVQCKPLMKTFTMADGSITAYATGAGTDSMTVELECSLSDARLLQTCAWKYGSLIFAGLHHMCRTNDGTIHPAADAGTELFFTGSITTEMISYQLNLCRASVPVQMVSPEVDGTIPVPAITAYSVTIYGSYRNLLENAVYQDNAYTLKQPILLQSNVFQIIFAPTLPSAFADRTIQVCLQQKDPAHPTIYSNVAPGPTRDAVIPLTVKDGQRETLSEIFSFPDGMDSVDYRLHAYSPSPQCKWLDIYFTVRRGDTA